MKKHLMMVLYAGLGLGLTPVAKAEARLWDESIPVPSREELPLVKGVGFQTIQHYQPDVDGYHFLHGVALAFHERTLWASFAHNKGAENTGTEEARFRTSPDGGSTWGEIVTVDAHPSGSRLAASHGVFLSHQGKLWMFLGAFTDFRQNVHTRAYVWNKQRKSWDAQGEIVGQGFWPMQEPVRMENGNWIMAGFQAEGEYLAAVAISRGDDLLQWDLVVIPKEAGVKMWGESTVIVAGNEVVNIARSRGENALVAVSKDYGKSWTASRPGNLPMVTSKPYAGVLSNGQRYLIGTTVKDAKTRRSPLTIAVSRPNEKLFSRIFSIRDAEHPSPLVTSNPRAALSYPYAIEHEGKLYVGYSNSAGRRGNNNSAELAIIPISSLSVD